MNKFAYCALLSIAALSAGCATLSKGNNQTITMNTDPSGAMCTMTREAKPVAVVNSTPGSVPVEKARGMIAVLCKKQGYQEAAGELTAEFQAMTLGNILFGGIVGVVIDAASGAMNQYPESVTISLIPEEFVSVEERDAFFGRTRASLEQEAAEVKQRITKMCWEYDCPRELAAADKATAAKLAEIEQERALARVRSEQAEAN